MIAWTITTIQDPMGAGEAPRLTSFPPSIQAEPGSTVNGVLKILAVKRPITWVLKVSVSIGRGMRFIAV